MTTHPEAKTVITNQIRYAVNFTRELPRDIIEAYLRFDEAQNKASCVRTTGLKVWETRRFSQFVGMCEWHGYSDHINAIQRLITASAWIDLNTMQTPFDV